MPFLIYTCTHCMQRRIEWKVYMTVVSYIGNLPQSSLVLEIIFLVWLPRGYSKYVSWDIFWYGIEYCERVSSSIPFDNEACWVWARVDLTSSPSPGHKGWVQTQGLLQLQVWCSGHWWAIRLSSAPKVATQNCSPIRFFVEMLSYSHEFNSLVKFKNLWSTLKWFKTPAAHHYNFDSCRVGPTLLLWLHAFVFTGLACNVSCSLLRTMPQYQPSIQSAVTPEKGIPGILNVKICQEFRITLHRKRLVI